MFPVALVRINTDTLEEEEALLSGSADAQEGEADSKEGKAGAGAADDARGESDHNDTPSLRAASSLASAGGAGGNGRQSLDDACRVIEAPSGLFPENRERAQVAAGADAATAAAATARSPLISDGHNLYLLSCGAAGGGGGPSTPVNTDAPQYRYYLDVFNDKAEGDAAGAGEAGGGAGGAGKLRQSRRVELWRDGATDDMTSGVALTSLSCPPAGEAGEAGDTAGAAMDGGDAEAGAEGDAATAGDAGDAGDVSADAEGKGGPGAGGDAIQRRNDVPLPRDRVVVALNCGGPVYCDMEGVEFKPDNNFSRSTLGHTSESVVGTSDEGLYHTCREGPDRGTLAYDLPLHNGVYTVLLKFNEGSFESGGHRVFDVIVDGRTTRCNVDLAAEAGKNRAVTLAFPVVVSRSVLAVKIRAKTGKPAIAAIVVLRDDGGAATRAGAGAGARSGNGVAVENALPRVARCLRWDPAMVLQRGAFFANGDYLSVVVPDAAAAASGATEGRHRCCTFSLRTGRLLFTEVVPFGSGESTAAVAPIMAMAYDESSNAVWSYHPARAVATPLSNTGLRHMEDNYAGSPVRAPAEVSEFGGGQQGLSAAGGGLFLLNHIARLAGPFGDDVDIAMASQGASEAGEPGGGDTAGMEKDETKDAETKKGDDASTKDDDAAPPPSSRQLLNMPLCFAVEPATFQQLASLLDDFSHRVLRAVGAEDTDARSKASFPVSTLDFQSTSVALHRVLVVLRVHLLILASTGVNPAMAGLGRKEEEGGVASVRDVILDTLMSLMNFDVSTMEGGGEEMEGRRRAFAAVQTEACNCFSRGLTIFHRTPQDQASLIVQLLDDKAKLGDDFPPVQATLLDSIVRRCLLQTGFRRTLLECLTGAPGASVEVAAMRTTASALMARLVDAVAGAEAGTSFSMVRKSPVSTDIVR